MKNKIEEFLLGELQRLGTFEVVLPPPNVEEEIYRLLMSNKFRKYSVSDAGKANIKKAIAFNVSQGLPINITFLQGCYKLWRLDSAPNADWAELFALSYYIEWLKPILAVYKPGVHLDFFMDDLALVKVANLKREEIKAYKKTFGVIIDFLGAYYPKNLKITMTPNSSLFKTEDDFWKELDKAVAAWKPASEIILTEAQKATIDLNVRLLPGQDARPLWREENARIHDAYMAMQQRQSYRAAADKINAIPYSQGWSRGIMPGSTKSSTVKYWTGVGVLKPRSETYMQTILSPSQLDNANFQTYDIQIKGLDGENFKQIRVLE